MFSKNQNKKLQTKMQIGKTISYKKIFFLIGGLFFLVFGFAQLTVIGQFIDGVFFRWLFGWSRWLVYVFLAFILIFWTFNLNWRKWIKKWHWTKVLWLTINFYWFFGFITIFTLVSKDKLSFSSYGSFGFNLFEIFFKEWHNNSIFKVDGIGFFDWNVPFTTFSEAGGLIGLFLASVSSYIYVYVAIVFNLGSWILMIFYMLYDNPFIFFISQKKRKQQEWERINMIPKSKHSARLGIQDQKEDFTMELPSLQKILFREKEASKTNKTLHKKTEKENIQEANWEVSDDVVKTNSSIQKKTEEKNLNEENTEFLFPEYNENQTFEKKVIPENNFKNNEKNNDFLFSEDKENQTIEEKNNFKNNFKNEKKMKKTSKPFHLPNKELFFTPDNEKNNEKRQLNYLEAQKNQTRIESVLKQHHVNAEIKRFHVGPNITKYEIQLDKSIRVQKILELEQEFKLELATRSVRFQAPIPGKSAIGIEIPNSHQTTVTWSSVLDKLSVEKNSLKLGIGKNIMNETEVLRLERLPHLLVAGQTGGGKSVCLTTIIVSLLFQKTPDELKFLMIDPKRVELRIFNNIPHMLGPVITNTELVPLALDKILKEIEKRYKKLEKSGTNTIFRYNYRNPKNKMPFIVIIIDELADLILTYRRELESKIVRIGQIARAVGIYLIVATQRPSSDIITGLIKTNIPGRIAFNVTNHIDSRTILNTNGAEKLLGRGDLLYTKPGQEELQRVQGAYLKEEEIIAITDFWKAQTSENFYWPEFANLNQEVEEQKKTSSGPNNMQGFNDTLYPQIKTYVQSLKQVSVSLLQRQFGIGFNRASSIFEKLENEKIISEADGNKPRQVLKND